MDAREILERRIDELCSENEQLRQQVASITGRSIRTADKLDCLETENAKLLDRVQELQAENAKLRELLRDVYNLHRSGLDCTECPWFEECNTTCGCPWLGIFANRLCELGILTREA